LVMNADVSCTTSARQKPVTRVCGRENTPPQAPREAESTL